MITTYAELRQAIDDMLMSETLIGAIPTFIDLCEADMNRRVRHWRMETRSTATLDGQYEDLPSDCLEIIRLNIQTKRQIELASVAEIIEKRRQYSDTAGEPRLYAVTANQIELWPTPDGSYTGEILYYGRIDALSSANTTNWVLSYHPDAYLYGALIHSAPYLKDDPRLPVWDSLYEKTIAGMNEDNRKFRFGGSGLRLRRRGLS